MKARSKLFRSVVLLLMLGVSHCLADSFIYVANQTDGTVSVVDQNLNSVIATVTVGPGPLDMVITPDGLSVFVLNSDSSISYIDASTPAFQSTILSFVSFPNGNWTGLGTDGTNVYVSVAPPILNSSGHIVQFSATSPPPVPLTGSATLPLHSKSSHVAITPDTTKGYSPTSQNSPPNVFSVSVISTPATTFLTQISTNIAGTNYESIAIQAATTLLGPYVFVAAQVIGASIIPPAALLVIDPATDTVVATSATFSNSPEAIAISPIVGGSQFAYIPDDDTTVSIVNVTNPLAPVLSSTVTVGNLPDAIALTTDNQFAYVANFSDNTLSVLNISSPGSPVVLPFTIGVGGGPAVIVTGPATFSPAGNVSPPSNLTGKQKKNDFALIYELYNQLKWEAPADGTAASFNIYRDGVLIANVSGSITKYEDHNRKKNVATTYTVTSVSSSGTESSAVTVVVN